MRISSMVSASLLIFFAFAACGMQSNDSAASSLLAAAGKTATADKPKTQVPAYSVLHHFALSPSDGASPGGSLLLDHKGNLYGTTQQGGAFNMGTVFKLDQSGVITLLYSFPPVQDGVAPSPQGNVIMDHTGNLYGTTSTGVFKLDSDGELTMLYNGPVSKAVIMDNRVNLYGTEGGGTLAYGAVFKLDRSGSSSVIHNFAGSPSDGLDPWSPLSMDNKGNLYGTTEGGGTFNFGTVYKIDKTGAYSLVHNFKNGTDGAYYPYYGGVIADNKGNLYGTTLDDFVNDYGTVYKIDAKGNFTVIHRFYGGAKDGAKPNGGLMLDEKGNLYGTTWEGGPTNDGTIFKIDRNGTFTLLHTFSWSKGVRPFGGLIMDKDGNLYGTTVLGGTYGQGTVYKLTLSNDDDHGRGRHY